ncbi:hypothetical protein CAPTEDRAFT_201783 [Capitella teleta]|uniref:PH domain-containing protein n=1 Tax=Capitella teleta TaxID=283909 RepID=R7U530_CAPTE|nr:hypothetical protein CAPTEDRAFT_201783 [Capitella teleta]|eukprot:ELU01074.1 hypothetical protein CAPTEDRAFT_201783 [Capitella teleta]
MDDMGTLSGDNARARKYQEGWTQHQSENSKDWNKFWIVLRGFMVFVFESDSTRRSAMVGTLTLNQDAECRSLPGDTKKKGYKMELITISAEGKRQMNKFKFASQNERDLWKSFVVGISQGIIPSDVHLLPGQLKNVHEAMAEVRNTPPPLPNIPRPTTLLPRPKLSQSSMNSESSFSSNQAPPSVRSIGSNESSDSGSFQTPKNVRSMSLSTETEEVTNLRQLMRRQSDLAFKALDTGAGSPHEFRLFIELIARSLQPRLFEGE